MKKLSFERGLAKSDDPKTKDSSSIKDVKDARSDLDMTEYKQSGEYNTEPDVSAYVNQGYDDKQIEEIRMGLYHGLDVSIYADPNINSESMSCARHTIEDRIVNTVVDDFARHGTSIDPGNVELKADGGIYVDDQKIVTFDDLSLLNPELMCDDLRAALAGQTIDDREVDDEEASFDSEL